MKDLLDLNQKSILTKLQKLPENEVTIKYIIPLLESLGYIKVEFYGGVAEKGKDILCWEYDKMEDISLTVAQVVCNNSHFYITYFKS